MMKPVVFIFSALIAISGFAQESKSADTSWKKTYRETYTRINDLVHTKLDVKFDYARSYMYGKAWITLKPHFYATDSLLLDAKGMEIKSVAVARGAANAPLKYKYDGMLLNIKLDRTYKGNESYTIYIDYTAKPDELKVAGSAAITDAKGLYFINPKGEDKEKPTQIWTQGETEATSVWCPTIDKPNQKTTQEIIMTVPGKYVTLSNGLLASQKKNSDGTRTDHWKMTLPHAPYLFFMGVGEFAVIKDSYKGKEVSYYVEQPYAAVARKIFGNTPEMISFFSKITGVDYPWAKYAQIVGRDYVSGAMENTTATLHQESAQQDARELIDGNSWEDVIAHELFHQWFGDYVTSESWSNLTLNESFANYSEVLWSEYKYGKDAGALQNYNDMQGYLNSQSETKDLVRFRYTDKEDMFDAVSYNKGGRILNMLRTYLGDSAFFKSLNLYLTTNKFKSAEAHQLRLAFEEVSGRDLNWFFNQWYFGAGHPNLDISYLYDDAAGKVTVTVRQTQPGAKVFRLPINIDIYNGKDKVRHQVWSEEKESKFVFAYSKRPDLVNVDADKVLLAVKKDDKTLDNFIHQYKYAGNYMDRREAVEFAAKNQNDAKAVELLKTAVKDPYHNLRIFALGVLDMKNEKIRTGFETMISDLAKSDPKSRVRAAAIGLLAQYGKAEYKALFEKAVSDSSYAVSGEALEALAAVDPAAALTEAKRFAKAPMKGKLSSAVSNVLIEGGTEEDFDVIAANFNKLPVSDSKFEALQPFAAYLGKVRNLDKFKKGIDMIVEFRDAIPAAYRAQTSPYINNVILKGISAEKIKAGLNDHSEYIISKTTDKKAF
ncbi:MAG: HEAT repeat domain-containing protein [Gemmatimonadaceae bacterium]|nr:HEAT repeat domain-containing protein [Chitinophagaceae bacterium]